MRWLPRWLRDPHFSQHLLRDGVQDEVVVDEVRHHWVAFLKPAALGVLGVVVFVLFLISPVGFAWFPLALFLVIEAAAGYGVLREHLDRFVVTNMRVFRVKGVFTRSVAMMPLNRILDTTMTKPLLGRLLGYGHFTFENAAQAQGLRDIRFVPRPDERDLAIQRVVQQSGLRGTVR